VSKISSQTSDLVVTWWAGWSLHGHSGHLLVMVDTVLQWPSSGSVKCQMSCYVLLSDVGQVRLVGQLLLHVRHHASHGYTYDHQNSCHGEC